MPHLVQISCMIRTVTRQEGSKNLKTLQTSQVNGPSMANRMYSLFRLPSCIFSDPEVESGDEVWGLGDDVAELARRQLPVVVDVRLEQHLHNERKNQRIT